jgi:hypothetical protein
MSDRIVFVFCFDTGNLTALWVIICSFKSPHGDEVHRLTACHG